MAQPNPNQNLSIGQRLQGGLGRVGQTLFPTDPSMPPDQANALRQSAIMQLGLGMMGASSKGAGFGAALNSGYGQASNNMQGAMQRAYENALAGRAETRANNREQRQDEQSAQAQAHQEWLDKHSLEREKTQDDRFQSQMDRQLDNDKLAQQHWEAEQKSQGEWRKDQLAARGGSVPSGYRLKQDGSLEFIPGGPADPAVANKANTGKLNEYEAKAVSFATRMNGAEKVIKDMAYSPHGVGGAKDTITSKLPFGNTLTSDDYQKYEQAAREWISGMLRFDSGAAVPETEFRRYFNTYFPQIGNEPAIIKQKEEARLRATQALEAGLSPVAMQRLGGPLGNPMPNGGTLYPDSSAADQSALEAEARRRGLIQ